MKKLLFFTLLFAGCINLLVAERISNYIVDVTVKQSGELFVAESITYDFESAPNKHGIYRDIPFMIKNSGAQRDIGLYNFSIEMDSNPVEWIKSTQNSTHAGKVKQLRIGSANKVVSGKHTYTISYNVKMGVLPAAQNSNNDSIRWNAIGTGWKVPIQKVKVNFFLPESLHSSNIATSSYTGEYGATDSKASTQWVNPRHLSINASNLRPFEGLTAELAFDSSTLDQNGIENIKPTFFEQIMGSWHWAALFGFLAFFYRKLKEQTGFIDKRSIAVRYLAPDDLTLLQAGLVLDKHADQKDFAAAVLELGYLGYIKINQKSEDSDPLLKRTSKVISGLSLDQIYLLNNVLFKYDRKSFLLSKGSASKAQELSDGFEKINTNLYNWSVADGHMVENPDRTRKSFRNIALLILLPLLALTIYSMIIKVGIDISILLLFSSIFVGSGILVFFQKGILNKVFGLVFAIMGGGIPLFKLMDSETLQDILISPLGVWLILTFAAFYVYKHVGKFTPKGAHTQKHLLGLEEFIKRVKEDEIKRRLEIDPLYLDRLLPYAMLFDQTKHWLSFYDILAVQTPTWYRGNIGNINNFDSSVNSASTVPSSSGGGGFSGGGGSSGGGGGGGGGGSW